MSRNQLFDFGFVVARVQEETAEDGTPTGAPHVTFFDPEGNNFIVSGEDCEGLIKLGRYLQQWAGGRVGPTEAREIAQARVVSPVSLPSLDESNSSEEPAKKPLQFRPV